MKIFKMKIKAICIDAKNKPTIIPDTLWVKESELYHITHIYKQVNQNGIQGCELAELDISAYIPYNCFRLDRFAFNITDLPKLIEMIKTSTALNDIDIATLIEELTTVEHEL